MSSQNRMRKELRSDKATRRPAWDDSDVGEAPVKKTNPRKPTSGKSSTERLASSRRPPSPVSSRRGGHVSEKSHSHHLPTPESSRNRTPNSEDDDLTEESDTDDTESDKGKQSAPHRPAEKTSATLGSKKGRHSSAAPTPSESTRPAGKKSKPTAASKRYDSETSGFDDLSDHSSDLSPGVFSEQDSDETGLDSVDRAMRETRRERRRSSARRAARARSKSVPPAADRWNDKKSKRDSTERKSRTTTGRGVTGASSKNKTSRGLVKPPLQILSCTDCSVQTDSAGINKLDCGDYLCNRCLKKRFKESVNNPNKFPPQCCKLDIPLKLANRFDENFRKTFNRRLAQHNRTKHTRRASSDPGDDLDDNRRFDEFTVPRPRRRAPKWNDRDRDEVGSGSARTAPTPRREAIKIKGWQHCYNCASTVEQREGEPSITCRCGAIFCTICGAKWKHCNCDSISYDPLLDSIDNDYHDVAQDFPPPDNMAYPRMMRDHQRVAGRVAGGPAVAGAEYYSAAARGGVRDHVRDAPRGGDYDMTGYDEFDDMDYAAAAPRPGVRDYAGGRDRTREPSTGQERAFAVNSARERMEIPMASRDRALAAAAGYGAQEYDYPEYPEYDESYDLPTGAAAGNMAAYRQDNYRREAVAANAAAAAEYTDRRAFGARRPGMAMAGGARPAPAPVYDDDYEDEYHPPAHSRYPAEKYATTAAAANGYMDEYDDYPEQAAMSARYPQSARQAPKYAGDEYERQRPAAYGGAHGGYVDEDMYEADEFRNGPPARAPSARAPSARAVAAAAAAAAAVANGFGRRAPMHANYEDDMMDDVDDMHDPRDAMEPRPARETREPMESREPRAPMRRKDPRSSVPPPATTRLRHSVAAPGYEDDSRRAVAKPQGNELVLNRRPGRGDEMDEDDESDGGYEAPPPPRRHQSVRARGARGGAMAATDDDIYDDYDRRMPSGPGLERHSMAGDLPPKGRRGARGASAGLADRFAHRNSMPPSPRTAPPFGGHMNGHGPHHGGPPMGGGPAMAPMGGPMGMGPGPMGGPMGGGPMGPGPMGGGPMRGPPPMGMGGPMGMGMGGPMGGPMGPGPGMPPMGPGMGPMGMGPGPMGPGGPMGGPPGMGPGAMTPYGRPPPPGGLPPQVPGAPLIHPPYRDDMYGPGGPGGPPRGDLMSPGGRHPGRGPPPPMEYDDEAAAGHGPSRRRRRYDAESDNVKSSTMAGLTGVGTGMTRVSEWVVHVPPGRPSPSLTAPR